MKKMICILLFSAILCSCLGACGQQASEADFAQRLALLPGVSAINVIEQQSDVFAEKYMITFTQPIDWVHPELGTFEQRVEIGFNDTDSYTVVQVGGYNLFDQYTTIDDRPELAYIIGGCNFVNVEYRFFGESCPAGLNHDSVEMWEYLTDKNASADFHAIIEALKTLLPSRWYFCGASKGGQATNVYAYYYPNDCFAYVAYVAPFADGIAMPGVSEAAFTTLGDTWLGVEKAASLRADLMTIIVDLVENRQTLQQLYWNNAIEAGHQYRSFVTPEILFDMGLLETVIQFWQTSTSVEKVENILALKDNDPQNYIMKCFSLMLALGGPENWAVNYVLYPYYIQAMKENGTYYYDFKYIREALEAAGATQRLAITEDMEKDILWNVVLTDEQKTAFSYDSSLREAMLNWLDSTESNVIMVYGACDPWTTVRLPDTDNPHVAVYILPDMAHNAMLTGITDHSQLTEAFARLLPERAKSE